MKFKNEIVSPKMAEKMLDGNTDNRRVRDRTVQFYAIQMQTGKWKSGTAEPIKLSTTGRVIDGQHRLLAVIKSKTPTEFTIAYDVDESVFDVLDTGRNRSGSDVFKVKGIKNDTILPAIISQYMQLKDGRHRFKEKLCTNNVLLEEYLSREIFWQGAANKTAGWYLNFAKILAPSMIGGLFALFYDINESTADEFMTQLCTGYNIKNKTVAALRNRLMQDKLSTLKMNTTMKTALIIKAWNMYRKNQEVKLIKFNQDKEEYPIAC
jgi:hypothetical protein